MKGCALRGVRYLGLLLLALASPVLATEVNWPRMADSADGVPIAYEVQGSGVLMAK